MNLVPRSLSRSRLHCRYTLVPYRYTVPISLLLLRLFSKENTQNLVLSRSGHNSSSGFCTTAAVIFWYFVFAVFELKSHIYGIYWVFCTIRNYYVFWFKSISVFRFLVPVKTEHQLILLVVLTRSTNVVLLFYLARYIGTSSSGTTTSPVVNSVPMYQC